MTIATRSITSLKMLNAAENLNIAALRAWPVSDDLNPSSISVTMSGIRRTAVRAV